MAPSDPLLVSGELCNFAILSQQNQVAQNSSGFVFCGLSFLEHDSLFRAMQFCSFEFTRSSCAEFLWFFTILLNTHTHNNNHVPCFVRKRTGVDSVVIFLSGFCSSRLYQNVGCIGSESVCKNWRAALPVRYGEVCYLSEGIF